MMANNQSLFNILFPETFIVQPLIQHYLEEYKRAVVPSSIIWDEARRCAFQDLAEKGLPTFRDEAWRYSARAPILQQPFKTGTCDTAKTVESLGLAKSVQPTIRLICLNGRFQFSPLSLPAGLEIQPIYQVMKHDPALLVADAFKEARRLGSGFSALNTLFSQDGIRIKVLDGYNNSIPLIEIYYLFSGSSTLDCPPAMLCVRNDIEVGENSLLQLVEHVGIVDDKGHAVPPFSCCNNTLTTALLKKGAKLRLGQSLAVPNHQAYVGQLALQQYQDSLLQSESLMQGGKLVRQTLSVNLKEKGAACELKGLSTVKDQHQMDHYVVINHQADHTNSDLHYRGIANDKGRLSFSGEVKAARDIQAIYSNQGNYNLLLSDQAEIDTKPRLTLLTDSIQCTHGATVGELDGTALFYLRSRGLSEQTARILLIRAFSEAIWGSMPLLLASEKQLLDNFLAFIQSTTETVVS